MTPEARAKLRELAMAAHYVVRDEKNGAASAALNPEYLAAVHPGAIIEMLDALEGALREFASEEAKNIRDRAEKVRRSVDETRESIHARARRAPKRFKL